MHVDTGYHMSSLAIHWKVRINHCIRMHYTAKNCLNTPGLPKLVKHDQGSYQMVVIMNHHLTILNY